jgi:predicted chitinase/LysM repeat protein
MSDTIYTVVSGDTATKITKKFNISLDVFKKLNPTIKDVNKLSIGQKVKVGEEVVEHTDYENEYTPIEEIDCVIKMPDGTFKFDLKNFSDDWDSEFYEVHTLENGQKMLLQSGYLDKLSQTQVVKVYGSTPIVLTLYINNDWIDANNDVKIDEKTNISRKNIKIGICDINIDKFFNEYELEFADKKLTLDIKQNLQILFGGISGFYEKYTQFKCEKRNLAYVLATARLETGGTFGSVSEAYWIKESYRKKYFEDMYDPILGKSKKRRDKALEIGNTSKGDGVKFHGRGYCQLTGKSNYKKAGDFLGLDLINNPELAKTPTSNAIKIILYGMHIGLFTGKKLSNYITVFKTDYVNARAIINGRDRANDIAGYAKKLEKCLIKAIQ